MCFFVIFPCYFPSMNFWLIEYKQYHIVLSLFLPFIVSKHGSHPFEWMTKEVKNTFQNPRKDQWVERTLWEDEWVGENSLSSLFSHMNHLSSSKNCTISNLLVGFENPVSFSFRFCRNLTTGK